MPLPSPALMLASFIMDDLTGPLPVIELRTSVPT
jgi:hypothetical protein